jgi:cysteine synthase A
MMQGWSPDFIPPLTEDAVTLKLIDEIVPVAGADALRCARDLARREGIFCGITGGATFAGALTVAATAPKGATLLCMLPDTGERYLSTPLFEDIPADMTPEELAISRSTPTARFDAPPPKPPTAAGGEPAVAATAEARDFVAAAIADAGQPVVMFALEWCEFCWSVRKLFGAAQIPFRAVDLDSVAYQADNRGGQIRAALKERTGWDTIPQIFIGGEFIGGCTEVFDAFREGRLQAMLGVRGVSWDNGFDRDPYSFLPTWLHPR